MYHLAVGDPNSISLGGRCTPEARKRREPSDGAMGNAPLPAGVLEPGSGIVFTVHGTCRSCGWGFGAVEISTVEMGFNKRCGETMVSVRVPPNGSIMWWLSNQRHQIFGQTLE